FLFSTPPPRSRSFPYTTLFRSMGIEGHGGKLADRRLHTAGPATVLRRLLLFPGAGRVLVVPARLGAALDPAARESLADVRFPLRDRKSTRLNSSHVKISYAVFC